MTITEVGKENLPNIYISSINISEHHGTSQSPSYNKFQVTVMVKDHFANPAWSGPNQMFEKLSVRYLFVYSNDVDGEYAEITNNLDQGLTTVMDYEDYSDFYQWFDKSELVMRNVDHQNDLVTFTQQTFTDIKMIQNMSLYICCHYKFDDELSNEYFKFLLGPLTSERIKVNSSLVQNSKYFYFPDTNKPYGGPVHSHENQYMEGSFHSNSPHKELRLVNSINRKITDTSSLFDFPEVDLEIMDVLRTTRHENITTSNMIGYDERVYSLSPNGSSVCLLHINRRNLLLRSTPNAVPLMFLNSSLYQKLSLERFKLKNIIIKKNTHSPVMAQYPPVIDQSVAINVDIPGHSIPRASTYIFNEGTPKESEVSFKNSSVIDSERPEVLKELKVLADSVYSDDLIKEDSHKKFEIYELEFMQNIGIHTIAIEDHHHNFGGNVYSYDIKIDFQETIDQYISNISSNLREAYQRLTMVLNDTLLEVNYDQYTNRFSEDYKIRTAEEWGLVYNPEGRELDISQLLSDLQNHEQTDNHYAFIVGCYVAGYNLLAPSTGLGLEQTILENILPFSANAISITNVLASIGALSDHLDTIYVTDIAVSDDSQGSIPPSENGHLELETTVDQHNQVFNRWGVTLAYKVFTNEGNLVSYSNQSFRSRLLYEEKYYNNLKTFDSSILSPPVVPHFHYRVMDKLNFVTPMAIKIENAEIDLSPTITDINSQQLFFFRLRAKNFISDTTPGNAFGDNAFSGKVIDTTHGVTTEQELSAEDLDDDVGQLVFQTDFGQYFQTNDDDTWFPNDESEITFIHPGGSSIPFDFSFLEDYPPHHKAMMLESFGIDGYDLFADHRFRRIIAETSMNVRRLLAWSNFEKDQSGLNILTKMRSQEIHNMFLDNNKPFFCTTTPHVPINNYNNVFKNTNLEHNANGFIPPVCNLAYITGIVDYNNYYYSSGVDAAVSYGYRDLPEYYTTNVVKQNPSKAGVLMFLNQRELNIQTTENQNSNLNSQSSQSPQPTVAQTSNTSGAQTSNTSGGRILMKIYHDTSNAMGKNSADGLRGILGSYYNPASGDYENYSENQILDYTITEPVVDDQRLFPVKTQVIRFYSSLAVFRDGPQWEEYVKSKVSTGDIYADHTFATDISNTDADLVKNHHDPNYEDQTKIYNSRDLLNHNLINSTYVNEDFNDLSLLRSQYDNQLFYSQNGALGSKSHTKTLVKNFARRKRESIVSSDVINEKNKNIYVINKEQHSSPEEDSDIWPFYFKIDINTDSTGNSQLSDVFKNNHYEKFIYQQLRYKENYDAFPFVGETLYGYNLPSMMNNIDFLNFREDQEELFLMNEMDTIDNISNRFMNQIRTIKVLENLNQLSTANIHRYEHIIDSNVCTKFNICYKIEKYLQRTNELIQTYYIKNDEGSLDFIDTQLKYGTVYRYKIYEVSCVFGASYSYKDLVISSFDDNHSIPADSDIDTSHDYRAEVKVEIKPSLKILEIPVLETTAVMIEDVPPKPYVHFTLANKGINIDLEPLGYNQFEKFFFEPIHPDEIPLKDKIELGSTDFTENDRGFKYFHGDYEIYRLSERPTRLSDFYRSRLNSVSREVSHLQVNKVDPTKTKIIKARASSSRYKDSISSNKKYYYLIRALGYHGTPSNPTLVYEVEVLQTASDRILKINTIDLEEQSSSLIRKTPCKRLIKIEPNWPQLEFSPNATNVEEAMADLGILEQTLFTELGNRFKIRLTSKQTGKKIDLNVNFKIIKRTN